MSGKAFKLPRHVHHVTARGRDYFYFHRGRGSGSPSERTRLPDNPLKPDFWSAYQQLLGERRATDKTFSILIDAYTSSPEFTNRATATKLDYRRYLKIIERAWGDLSVARCRPKHVIHLRDEWADRPTSANMLLSVLRLLIAWGVPREYCETNPCLNIPKIETKVEGARPWPCWAYKLIDKHATEPIRRAVMLARYTGQRQADVLRMSPDHIEDGGIVVTQQKTGKELWVPLHASLSSSLVAWGGSLYVLNRNGTGYTPASFRAAWSDFMGSTPAGRIRGEGFVFHGLRAASCEALREAGCNDLEIGAITGMSSEMITRYSRFADQRKLARAAARRLEL